MGIAHPAHRFGVEAACPHCGLGGRTFANDDVGAWLCATCGSVFDVDSPMESYAESITEFTLDEGD